MKYNYQVEFDLQSCNITFKQSDLTALIADFIIKTTVISAKKKL